MSGGDAPISSAGGSSKMLLIVGLVIGLAAGGAGGFIAFKQMQAQSHEGEAGDGAQHTEKEKAPEIPATLYSVVFEQAVPIYDRQGTKVRFLGNYFIKINLQTAKEVDQLKVRASEPKLRHAFVDAISKENLMQAERPEQLDYDRAQKSFMMRADKILGEGVLYALSIENTIRVAN